MPIPETIDRTLLQTYLSDHLTGATGGRARALKMAQWYADSDIGPDLARVAAQIDAEQEHLKELIDRLGLTQPLPKLLAARLGELAGRLKANGRALTGSPMTPLLELELLRMAVNGKQGLWETLAGYAPELGLDPQRYRDLAEQARTQERTLEDLHGRVRGDALRPGSGPRG
ncbi:MAG: hypothetical protein WCA30_11595 [Dermatophilaceae bacterium]